MPQDAEFWASATPIRCGRLRGKPERANAVVHNPSTGEVHLLNPSAFAIWELCDGKTTALEIADAVAQLTDANIDRALHDVETTILDLNRVGLIDGFGLPVPDSR